MNVPLNERTFSEVLRNNLTRAGQDTFLTLLHAQMPPESFTYGELLGRAAAWNEFYRLRGLKPGDRVVVILHHSVDLYAAYIGAILGGIVPTMFAHPSPKHSEEVYFATIDQLLANSKARLLVTYTELAERLSKLVDDLPTFDWAVTPQMLGHMDGDITGMLNGTPVAVEPPDTAFLQYSSGTTGLKKGVAVTHSALLWQLRSYADAIDASDRDVIVSWLPLYHDMGLICCLFLPLFLRAPLVAMSPFDWVRRPHIWPDAIASYGGTFSWLPNFAYNFMAKNLPADAVYDLSSLRAVINCAEPIQHQSHAALLKRLGPSGLTAEKLATAYAMAETTFAVSCSEIGRPVHCEPIDGAALSENNIAVPTRRDAPNARKLVSSGRLLADGQIRIIDNQGQEQGERCVGEILVRSPSLMAGYDGNPEATAAAFDDGYYRTGDIGFVAEGELYVIGRRCDTIIVAGHNLFPQDVEALLDDHPDVIDGRSVAFGVDDEESGTERLVVIAETHLPEADHPALKRQIFANIASSTDVVPADIRLVPHQWLRKSTSGKIARKENKQRYMELADESAKLATLVLPRAVEDLAVKVRTAVQEALSDVPSFDPLEITDTTPLISSGLVDSFNSVNLIQAVEEATGTEIPDQVAWNTDAIDTIAAITETVLKLQNGEAQKRQSGTAPACPEDIDMATDGPVPEPRHPLGFWTLYYRALFKFKGIRFGKGLRVLGPIILRLEGDPKNIVIGDNVTIMPWVDLKIRENGRIFLGDGVALDTMVRLVAANDARIELGCRAQLGIGTVVNAGADVIIGRESVSAGYCTIIASEHRIQSRAPIMRQGYHQDPVYIGADVWIASHSLVSRGCHIGQGAVIGANSVVKGEIPPYSILAGNPARIIKTRT